MKLRDVAIGAICLSLGAAAGYAGGRASVQEGTEPVATSRKELSRDNVLVLLNEARLEGGLPQLSDSIELSASAQEIAEKISASGDCTHEFLRQRRAAGNDPDSLAGENLACGVDGAEQAVEGLLASPTHRSSILDGEIKEVGIGIAGNDLVLHMGK